MFSNRFDPKLAEVHDRRLPAGAMLLVLIVVAAMTGCGGVSGTFQSDDGHTIEFNGDMAYITIVPAPAIEATYTHDSNTIVLTTPGDQIVLTRVGNRLDAAVLGMSFFQQQQSQ